VSATPAARDGLRDRVLAFLRDGGDLTALALDVFARQRRDNPAYGRIAEGAAPTRIEEIPAVPVELFKSLDLTCFPPADARIVFRTSGTTGMVRGVHRLLDTALYDAGCIAHFRSCVPGVPTRVVSLCPSEPDSSLGHMVALFARPGAPEPLFTPDGIVPHAWDAFREGPVFLTATAFALDALFAMPGAARLGPDSLVMVTGGFKGRRVRLDGEGLYRAIGERLGAPRVVGEYGMTELSSQLWTDPVRAGELPGAFRAPPWMRVYTVDPLSGEPCAGEGLLRFVDLCNLDSVLAIETRDLGRVDGPWVTLRGRLEGAEARGCSLRAEDLLRRAGE
jgi:acyl-CoA synthetase (AMP-forming)/AMP-acid ligase II